MMGQPRITFIDIGQNCFVGDIPDVICNSLSLRVLIMEGLRTGTSCRVELYDPLSIIHTYFLKETNGLLPECLWGMSRLETLHLSGNMLSGSIPDSVNFSSMEDLSLSFNKFTGVIPDMIQQHHFKNIDLSYNKFSGDVNNAVWGTAITSDDVHLNGIKLQVNRISGDIPSNFYHVQNIDV